MTIIIFIAILLLLVLIHEAGHFFAAKLCGVKVEEFAFGFPPRIFSVKKGETNYVFNALPIGGYVKIFGENGEVAKYKEKDRNFVNKSPIVKIFILSAGVIMNIVLAYALITISLYGTTNFQVDSNTQEYQTFLKEGRIKDEYLVIANVLDKSPAKRLGLVVGDKVNSIYLNQEDEEGKAGRLERHGAGTNFLSTLGPSGGRGKSKQQKRRRGREGVRGSRRWGCRR